ncbi:MAG: hypothetical protein HYV20_14705 [Gemmatimonadetes bacterium]|nr:hypothetical protein [Gemmatimonadota bacterium]
MGREAAEAGFDRWPHQSAGLGGTDAPAKAGGRAPAGAQALSNPRPGDPAYAARVPDLRIQIAYRRALYPPCNDAPQTIPCYFNTGCCKFEDGDITGMELENGRLRLVKWPAGGSAVQASVLEEGDLASFFAALP